MANTQTNFADDQTLYYQDRQGQGDAFKRKQFTFNGEWLPHVDPLKIGDNNFSDINNFRYNGTDIEGVSAYSKITNNPIATYINGRAGIQLRTPFTNKSIILAQQFNAGLTGSQVFINTTLPPSKGDFVGTPLYIDPANADIASFAPLISSNVLYCNGTETKIYAGDEQQVAAFILSGGVTGLTITNPIDVTDRLRNIMTDSLHTATISVGAGTNTFLIASTRPLSAVKIYVYTPNGSVSVITGYEWIGTAWSALGALVDGTSVGGISLAQTGTISFTSTETTSKPAFMMGLLVYWYKFTLSVGSAVVYFATINAPIQNLVDLWDGQFRYCIQAQDKRGTVWEDYTAELGEISNATYPIAAKWGGLTAADQLIWMFTRRTCGVKISFIAGKVNAAAGITLTIYYCNGSAWTSVGTVYDGTAVGGTTFAQTGFIFWNPAPETLEYPTQLFDTVGYAYKIVLSGTLTTGTSYDGVSCDSLFGITSPSTINPRGFGFSYKNRTFLANYNLGLEPNRLDYGPAEFLDCFNGDDSSDNNKQLYIGGSDDLVGAVNIFNRFGTSLYNTQLLLKQAETHLLDGDDPKTFKLFAVSTHIGCPAPRTITTAEIAYEISKDAMRNIALWLSARGPVLFDAAILVPLHGLNNYFDPLKDECINYDYIDRAHAWFDPCYSEWNLCFPSGVGQVDCNVWVFYSMIYKRWAKKNTGTQPVPQATFQVNDVNGNLYTYALFNNGHMAILENGSLWNDTEYIKCDITSGEQFPSNDIFDVSFVRRYKLIRETPLESDISYMRSDFVFHGQDYQLTGYALTYGEVIEVPGLGSVYWDGDNLKCGEIRENVSLGGLLYRVTGGLLEIANTITENIILTISTTGGDFVAAGFIPGLPIYTDDVDYLGPLQVDTVATTLLTLIPGSRGPYKNPGVNRTITAYYMSLLHYLDGEVVPTRLVPKVLSGGARYQRIIADCGRIGLSHKIKFEFNSVNNEMKVKPLAWGYQYMVEREDI